VGRAGSRSIAPVQDCLNVTRGQLGSVWADCPEFLRQASVWRNQGRHAMSPVEIVLAPAGSRQCVLGGRVGFMAEENPVHPSGPSESDPYIYVKPQERSQPVTRLARNNSLLFIMFLDCEGRDSL
jgi:hypothetical protein